MIVLTNSNIQHARALGAWAKGERAVKINSTPRDGHQDGDKCTIVASIRIPIDGILYIVKWDDQRPADPVAIFANQLKVDL